MKTKTMHGLLLVGLIFGLLAVFAEAGEKSTQQLFQEGRTALYAGDRARAHELFKEVLQRDPRHTTAKFYYEKSKPEEKKASGNMMQIAMSKLIVPRVEFADAPLGEVIEFISQKGDDLSGGSIKPNIVYTGPPEDLKDKKVTLKLSNVPLGEVLRYAGELTKTSFTYGQYAIEGRPAAQVTAQLKAAAEARAAAEAERSKASASQAHDPFAPKKKDDSLGYLEK